ncbi:hypothetical protein C8R47DRAFT_1169717 [Mycena vitilis]|nr:hypothetical protein C8R47DRAFT_1169717 [Mycena vitilis]
MDTALSGDEEEPNERLDKAWKILCSKFPGFHARLLNLSGDPVTRRAIVKQMTLGADSVRSADTSTVKRGVPKWLLKDPLAPLEPPLPNATSKAHRGLVHPAFATGLTPMTKAANTSTWTQVLEGEIHLTGDQLPGFIFPCGQIFPIDKPLDDPAWADVLENACKGEVCLRSAKAIYQGPEAALEGDGFHKGKPGNASIIGLSTFTPRTVANVITQVRFGLSSMAEWNKMEGDHFDYEEFFWTIHDLFKDEELGASIISLWNKVVFGNAKPSNAGPAASGPSALSIIQAARAAKKAAAAPAAP